MLLALKRVPDEIESSLAAAGTAGSPPLFARRRWRSSSWTRRFNAAISERYVVEDFLREEVSRRISFRATRAISSFRTDATLDIKVATQIKVGDLKARRVTREAHAPTRSVICGET